MNTKRLMFIALVVPFIFTVNASGGDAVITGQYKGFTLIKADCSILQEKMAGKGFSRYVTWLAFTDFKKRQVWFP
jgi:predicted GNAT family acetyltransferase